MNDDGLALIDVGIIKQRAALFDAPKFVAVFRRYLQEDITLGVVGSEFHISGTRCQQMISRLEQEMRMLGIAPCEKYRRSMPADLRPPSRQKWTAALAVYERIING